MVAYRPASTSLRKQAELAMLIRDVQKAGDDADQRELVEKVVNILYQTIVDWDITLEGKPVPITQQILGDMPRDVFGSIMEAINGDREDPEEKKLSNGTSGDTLQMVPQPGTVPNGTPSYAPQNTWASHRGN
jgi:hypothetical protein